MTPLVSVIIPVYKVEKYIEKCIQSLLDQTYENFEALVIDDGSPDSSIAIAKELVGDDTRFIFFEKENGGQGSARNLGLDHTKGEYIAFLDSDDYYNNEYLSVMLKEIIADNADVCICNIRNVTKNGEELSVRKNNLHLYIENKDYLMAHGFISNFMWDKLFDASCFECFRFDSSIRTYEDVHLLFRVLYGKKITSTDELLYNYVQRPDSTVHSLSKTYIEDRYKGYLKAREFYEARLAHEKLSDDYIKSFFLNNFVFFCSVNIVKYSDNYLNDIRILISKDSIGLLSTRNIILNNFISKKARISLLLLKTNPTLYKHFIKNSLKLRRIKEIL